MNSRRREAIERGTGGAPLRPARRNPTPAEVAFFRDLRQGLGREQVLTAPKDLLCYGFDAAADLPPGRASAVVFPRSTAEVARAVQVAGRHRRPIFARGAGTTLSGGTVRPRAASSCASSRCTRSSSWTRSTSRRPCSRT